MATWFDEARLDDDQRATLLVHELAHLRRRDHWVRCLELIATALYWWHPLVWWTRGRLRDAEEQCCDAWVTWLLPSCGRAYAQALLETVDFLSGARRALPPVASAAGQFPVLKRRLTMILHGTTPRRLSTAGLGLVSGAARHLHADRLAAPLELVVTREPVPRLLGRLRVGVDLVERLLAVVDLLLLDRQPRLPRVQKDVVGVDVQRELLRRATPRSRS